jgi:hypothetical protein
VGGEGGQTNFPPNTQQTVIQRTKETNRIPVKWGKDL